MNKKTNETRNREREWKKIVKKNWDKYFEGEKKRRLKEYAQFGLGGHAFTVTPQCNTGRGCG